MGEVDCLPGYSWYVCKAPGRGFRGCCSIDACRLGCPPEYQQVDFQPTTASPTMTITTSKRRTITSTITLPLKSTLSSEDENTSLRILSTLSTSSTPSIPTVSVSISEIPTSTSSTSPTPTISIGILELPTSTPASVASGTSRTGAHTTIPNSRERDPKTPIITGAVVGGFFGCIALLVVGYWVFHKLRKSRTVEAPSMGPPKPSAPRVSSPIPWTSTRVLDAASTTTTYSGPSTLLQISPSHPPTVPSQTAELPGSPTTLTAPPAPIELPLQQNPAPRVSIYDPSTLAMTVQREAATYLPHRSLSPLAGNHHLRRAVRRRGDFEPTRPRPVATRSMGNLNTQGPRQPGQPGTSSFQREVDNSSHIRHLSWQDWAEQGIYMTHGPSPSVPAAGGQGSRTGDARGDQGAVSATGHEQGGSDHDGQGYGMEAQLEGQGGDTGRAAMNPANRYSC